MLNTNVLQQSSRFVLFMALGPYAGTVIKTINQWLSNNGVEWTVKRLKDIRSAAMQLRAGNPLIAKSIYQENSIAYFHGSLLPRGSFYRIVRLYTQCEKPSCLRRLDACLRVYTGLVLKEVSQNQANKALKAITTPYQGSESALFFARAAITRWQRMVLSPMLKSHYYLVGSNGEPKLAQPNLEKLKPLTSTHKSSVKSGDFRDTPYGAACLSLCSSTVWPRSFQELYNSWRIMDFIQSIVWSPRTDNDYAGHISFIQEAGAKARVVAVPNAWLQWGFQPLHEWLDSVLQILDYSCVHDQNKGAWYIQERLKADCCLYSFDLTSATDRFPLTLQLNLLENLGLGKYADALQEVTNEDWYVSTGPYKGQAWKYECGQPMGLYGSFPLFSLTHIALLGGLCLEEGISLAETPFLLLGDDVVISNPKLAHSYEKILKDLGVEVSFAKSMKSSKVAEFAGFVGYRTNKSVALHRPYKHKNSISVTNPISMIFSLGRGLRRTGSPTWISAVQRFGKTRSWRNPDLSPLISNQDQGGVMPPQIDTTRLANLLHYASAQCGVTGNSYTGEELSLDDIENLAMILLDKQDSVIDNNTDSRELLSTPERPEQIPATVEQLIYSDPLMTDSFLEFSDRSSQLHNLENYDDYGNPVDACEF